MGNLFRHHGKSCYWRGKECNAGVAKCGAYIRITCESPIMTEQELMELSRQAAGCLPVEICKELKITQSPDDGIAPESSWASAGTVAFIFDRGCVGRKWLHESTEACTEIMVRVLWLAGAVLSEGKRVKTDHVVIAFRGQTEITWASNADPMLAFRVAVLRALIALKAQS